tara:strand:+ start:585 stop:818 length:234 start_codon:yes stop_codon:yes gene_type:complete
MKVNWNKVVTTLTGIAIIAFLGGILDFQNIKAEVKGIKKHNVNVDVTLKAVGVIICRYAIKDKMEDAAKICKDVLTK